MPNVEVKKLGKKYRLVEQGTKRIARNEQGTVRDGGGHESRGKALRQKRAVNHGLSIKRAKGGR